MVGPFFCNDKFSLSISGQRGIDFAKNHMSAVFLSKPSLVDVGVSAFVAVAVIVWSAT